MDLVDQWNAISMNDLGLPEHTNSLRWDPESFKAKFFIQKKSRTDLEKQMTFIVCSKSQLEKVVSFKDYSKVHSALSKEVESVFKDGVKNQNRKFGDDPYKEMSFRFFEGGVFTLLVFDDKVEPFFIFEGLRKSFSNDFKKYLSLDNQEELSCHVSVHFLEKELQGLTLEGFGALSQTLFWEVPSYKKATPETEKTLSKKRTKKIKHEIGVLCGISAQPFEKWIYRGQMWGKALNLSRSLAERAGNDLTPDVYVQEIKKLAINQKIEFEFWNEKALVQKKAGAFLAVSRANTGKTSSGIVRLQTFSRSRLKKSKKQKQIALVGKGLCFDTGGYNIKTGTYMFGMHDDMTGSAIALASLLFLRETAENLKITAYLAISENLISPTGFRPNDVVTTASGKSIEIVDTDAEGRMVLADTLYFAAQEKPDLIVDFATLTGSAVRALGTDCSAVFSNQPQLLERAVRAGHESGERVWAFPLGSTYERALKSKTADIKQCLNGGNCDMIYAATFLNEFVPADIPWLHVDLSAHSSVGGLGLVDTETTGFGVRFTDKLINQAMN